MKTIYIFTHGTTLFRSGRRLIIKQNSGEKQEILFKDIGRILIYGRTEITAQTMDTILEANIPIYYVRRSGAIKGKIGPSTGKHITLRQTQYRFSNDTRLTIPMAKAIVRTKLRNMQAVIHYILNNASGTAAACMPLEEACQRLSKCDTREEIMGVEGAAARHYFQIYGNAMPAGFTFRVRSRPAQDPCNALLNLGYMTLLREVHTHLEAHDLDPYLGILHATQENRPSLALDLLEEFRQPLVDIFIRKIICLGQIKSTDFQTTQDGIQMLPDSLKKFFQLYEENMGTKNGDNPGLRKIIDEQVEMLKKHILGESSYRHLELDTITSKVQVS